MNYFDHIYLPEQVIPAPGVSPVKLLIEELKKIRQESIKSQKPNYFLENLLSNLNNSYLENEEKQAQCRQLIQKLKQKYGEENINFRKLEEGLLIFFLAKSIRKIIYTPPSRQEQMSHDEILLEYHDFLSYREIKKQLTGQRVIKFTQILEGSSFRPTQSDYSGVMERKRKQHFDPIDAFFEKILTTFCNLGFTAEAVKTGFENFLYFDLDILLHNWVYTDFYSFISKEAISKTARYEVMYDIFLITHYLTPAAELRAYRDLDEEYLAKDPEYRTYRLNEVKKILYKKAVNRKGAILR